VDTCGYIMLDGYLAPGRFLYGEGMAWRGGVRSGPTSERPFVFQQADENGEIITIWCFYRRILIQKVAADLDSTLATGKDVGTIILRIKRVKLTAAMAPNSIQQLPGSHTGKNGMRVGYVTHPVGS
jgi:hypothetical protein